MVNKYKTMRTTIGKILFFSSIIISFIIIYEYIKNEDLFLILLIIICWAISYYCYITNALKPKMDIIDKLDLENNIINKKIEINRLIKELNKINEKEK